jgi:long-chain acyl-CoA synthetase
VNAIVDAFDRLWRDAPARPLIHLPLSRITLTVNDLQRAKRGYVTLLTDAGISHGHIVVSVVGNRPAFLPLLLAAWTLDAVVMPVEEETPPQDIDELCVRFGAAVVVRPCVDHTSGGANLEAALTFDVTPHSHWQRHPDLGLLKLTSGSSGTPKAVAVTAAAMINDTAHITEAMCIGPDDVQIAVIPLSHAYGFGNLVLPLLLQGTAIVLREAFVPQALVGDVHAFNATIMAGVPFMFQHLATHLPADSWPRSLTWLVSAGARLSPEVIRTFHGKFGLKIHSFYGASESGGIAFDYSDGVDDAPTVGWPMPGVAIELCPDEGVPNGYGRVLITSNAVAERYVGAPSADESLLGGGRFLTGDYGTLLSDGRLLLAGRVSTFINVAGRKVQPAEVEQALRAVPGVTDVRVLAVADPVRGEHVAAVLAGENALSLAAIRQFCARRLPPHKVPRVIVVVPTLPLTARGKPDIRALQALVDAAAVQVHKPY